MSYRARRVTCLAVSVLVACFGLACAAPSVSPASPSEATRIADSPPEATRIAHYSPLEDGELKALAVADRKALVESGCQENPGGEKIARACSISLSLATCALAHPNELGCCMTACSLRIGYMTSAVIENTAQACAARVRLSPAPVNPVCDFSLPTFSPIRREQFNSSCLERCKELLSRQQCRP